MTNTYLSPVLRALLLDLLLLASGAAVADTTVNLTAQRASAVLPDGVTVPMWRFCGTTAANPNNSPSTGTASGPGTTCSGGWNAGPTITVAHGEKLTINLTNQLRVPTSIVVLGLRGGGLGQGTRMASPAHDGQTHTTFPGNGVAATNFAPPAQATRVQSFGSEAPPGSPVSPGMVSLTWADLKPGTYIYETGSLPSLQVPMGLYGLLVVTQAPTKGVNFAPGDAYPGVKGALGTGVPYDADVSLLFSEIDPVQNAQVSKAEQNGTKMEANLRFDSPACVPNCYPAAVNYRPTYFLINGRAFDRSQPALSSWAAGDTYSAGKILLRLANAGSRTHVPSVVGLPMSIVAEDGNLAPGLPKQQNEVLLTAGKTYDTLLAPAATAKTYRPGTFGVFDRQGSLTTANQPDGGMQGYLLVNGAKAVQGGKGAVPAAASAMAVNDAYSVSANTAFNGNVKANDIAVKTVTLRSNPSHGTVSLNADGSFIYTPSAGADGATFTGSDSFTYDGNDGTTNLATVTLTVGAPAGPPVANDDAFTSVVSKLFRTASPGVLANDTDPANLKISVDVDSVTNGTCGTVSMTSDGGFSAVRGAGPTCQFSYRVKNSQGVASVKPATVQVSFASGSGLALNVIDAKSSAPITDYRWVLQEDLTFKPDLSGTPSLDTRTLGTSFHRAHNPVVATGCVGRVSCGTDQQVRGVVVPAGVESRVGDVFLDPTRRYYVSVLPGDAQNPVINGGGAPVKNKDGSFRAFDIAKDCLAIGNANDPCGHMMGGTAIGAAQMAASAASITLQRTPLVPAQLSIFIYEDNSPTNGQYDLNEQGLGGFNIILFDPVGRSGDPAGQQTYDAFNMPISNALLGTPGCPNTLNKTTAKSAGNDIVGVVYTCPNAPNPLPRGQTAADYALAGHALIQNITPARYDVIAHPGAEREGAGEIWWQTETLEGTPAQDAFTGINEARYFQEFGPPGFHTTIGWVNPLNVKKYAKQTKQVGPNTITGQVTNQHMSRPSNTRLWDSGSYDLLSNTNCRVTLNAGGGTGATIAATECTPDGHFTFIGVPEGSYQVAVFDQWLDQIIETVAVTVPHSPNGAGQTVAMGNIPVLSWFTQHDQYQLLDDGTGTLTGIPNVNMTVRYRNGSISNQTLTDVSGNGILVEMFPLFNWYVSESNTTRYKQKAVRITVDGGGKPDDNLIATKYPTGESTIRTETPGAYSYGIQSFISQRNKIEWIDTPYTAGENGGIQGVVVYASTRAFDDQRLNVQTIWEPLVPRVSVNLYRRSTNPDGTIALTKVDSTQTSSWDDWVNAVQGADYDPNTNPKPYLLGPDQKLRDLVTGNLAPNSAYPPGPQFNMQCPGQLPKPDTTKPPFDTTKVDPFTEYTLHGDRFRCYDGFHVWNQVQAAPYDGRYHFPSASYVAAHPLTDAQKKAGQTLVSLPPGDYVVEAVTPQGYEVVAEEDKNILIGDAFIAPVVQQFGGLGSIFILPDQATLNNANPNNPNTGDPGFQSNPTSNLNVTSARNIYPECVGALHRVPDFLTIFPQAKQVAPFAGMDRPLCDKKLVSLTDQMRGVADFFVKTNAPIAANATGIILDDAASEFNSASPDFGEKASVPFVPVSTKDFAGREISRVYADQWGAYNLMLPSSWLVNPPTPSGYGPNMLVSCINDPGPVPATNALGQWVDSAGNAVTDVSKAKMVTDPAYNPGYSNFCYTNPFMPGQATYLDTPVLPIAAFASGYTPVDCEYPDATPAIARVDGSTGVGPYLPLAGGTLTITALGDRIVQNPAYAGPFATSGPSSQRSLTRHYGFGSAQGAGSVTLGGVPLAVTGWSDTSITVVVPAIAKGSRSGELVITAANGKSTVDAVTVTQEAATPTYIRGAAGQTIQAAIDNAKPGDLLMVDAGTYNELVVMWKPVRLQGVGASSVIINAAKYPTTKLQGWRPLINAMFGVDSTTGNQAATTQVDPLPGQEVTGGVVLLEPSVLGTEEGAGITVLAKGLAADGVTLLTGSAKDCTYASTSVTFDLVNGAKTSPTPGLSNFLCASSRIDGVSVTGGDAGGGIYVNGWAHNLEIANNRVYGNAGALNGGVRIGVPYLETVGYPGQIETANGNLGGKPTRTGNHITGLGYDVNVRIHHNAITKNGVVEGTAGNGGAGGGVSICTGTDQYSVDHNFICGNYSQADGGGIGHLGFSQGGAISFNQVLFNQSFQQTVSTHGGGIFVGGEPPGGLQTRSLGSGNVTIDANIITGNLAESGHGGGIRLQQVNGADIENFPATHESWNRVSVTNNIINNNVAGWSGGGISMADVVVSSLVNNTIASNDSAGISGALAAGGSFASSEATLALGKPNPAGISSEQHSQLLKNVLPNSAALTDAQKAVSFPDVLNNIIWHNRSFFAKTVTGNASLCSSNDVSDTAGAACSILPEQVEANAVTGACTGSPAFWDIGVVGDTSATYSLTTGLAARMARYSVLSPMAGYTAMDNNRTDDPMLAKLYCNGARLTPEFGSVLMPSMPMSLQVAATADEGNNFVNLRFGPLSQVNAKTGAPVGDYHLSTVTDASGAVTGSQSSGYRVALAAGAPKHDVDNDARPDPYPPAAGKTGYDIGADQVTLPMPVPLVNPAALDFGNVIVGQSADLVVTLSNAAAAHVALQPGTSTASAPFRVIGTTCVTGGTGLAAGQSCTVTVRFLPTAKGATTGTLTITSANAPALVVPLNGSGTAKPISKLAPANHDFGTQTVGTTSAAFIYTLSNNSPVGGAEMVISAAATVTDTAATPAADQFTVVGSGTTCIPGLHLLPNASCAVAVSFAPTSAGVKGTPGVGGTAAKASAVLAVPFSGTTETSGLLGTGTAPPMVSPGTISFTGGVGQQTVTLTNPVGNPTITVNRSVLGQVAGGTFTLSTTAPGSCATNPVLGSGASCTVVVNYVLQKGATTSTATLTFTTNSSATGVPPPPTVSITGTK